MKKNKIIYWTTTGLISLMMLFSAYSYFTNPEIKGAFVHLGFPEYFRVQLGVAKIIGALILILPMITFKIKEFAYFGFSIIFVSASIAHLASGDPVTVSIMPLVFLFLLLVSYIYFLRNPSVQKKYLNSI